VSIARFNDSNAADSDAPVPAQIVGFALGEIARLQDSLEGALGIKDAQVSFSATGGVSQSHGYCANPASGTCPSHTRGHLHHLHDICKKARDPK
jgi:hypothetical protein